MIYKRMVYLKETVRAGQYIFTEKHYSLRYGKKNIPRGPNIGKTSEQQQRINEFKKRRKLLWIFCANFINGDKWITLTYKRGKRPDNMADAIKDRKRFLRKLRDWYRKNGIPFVYMAVTERGTKGGLHHHIVIRGIVDYNIVAKAWEKYGGWQAKTIGVDNIGGFTDDILNLARYFIKGQSELSEKNYTKSNNLRQPKIKVKVIHAERWTSKPRPLKGYMILDVHDGFHDFFGKPYQDYIQRRLA